MKSYLAFPLFVLICAGFGAGVATFTPRDVPAVPVLVLSEDSSKIKRAASPFVPEHAASIVATPETDDTARAQRLFTYGFTTHIYAATNAEVDSIAAIACQADAERVISLLPAEFLSSLQEVRLYMTPRQSRGLANGGSVELQCVGLSREERMAVLIHEIGHVIDLGYITGDGNASTFMDGQIAVQQNDPSVDFYSLSFRNSDTRRVSAQRADFVSGYAMSSSFEDFSESFTYYVLHGDAFRQLTTENAALSAKYAYIRDTVFAGKEFQTGGTAPKGNSRPWDTTLLPYDTSIFTKSSK